MTFVSIPADSTARLDELASILAAAILRVRYRRVIKRNPPRGTRENKLEVVAWSSAHGNRNGEHP